MSRSDLVVVVFDVLARRERGVVMFGVGLARWILFRETAPQRVSWMQLAENVYWDPVNMLGDLRRRQQHALLSFDSRDARSMLVDAAIPPDPGPYLTEPGPADIVAVGRRMRALQLDGGVAALFRGPTSYPPPTTVLGRLVARWRSRGLFVAPRSMEWVRAIGPWIAQSRQTSALLPPGVTGMATDRIKAAEALRSRVMDLTEEWRLATAHPELVELETLVAEIGRSSETAARQGHPMSRADAMAACLDGDEWAAVDWLRGRLSMTTEVAHLGLCSTRIGCDLHAVDQRGDYYPGVDSYRSTIVGSMYTHHLPTTDWWARLRAIAEESRS